MFGATTTYAGTFGKVGQDSLTKSQMIKDRGVIYKTNGTGRDTYIFNDNGGFSTMYQPTNFSKPGTFLPKVPR